MPVEGHEFPAVGNVDQANELVGAAGGEAASVGAEGERGDPGPVAWSRAEVRDQNRTVPSADAVARRCPSGLKASAVAATGGDEPAGDDGGGVVPREKSGRSPAASQPAV